MMERAAVPPRTIKKVSDLFGAATFILDFFWGGIKSPKNTTLSSEFESSLQNVFSASRHSNFGPISKAAFFWILGEGHTAALRAGVSAWVLWRAPWGQWGGRVQQVSQFPHDRDGHAPLPVSRPLKGITSPPAPLFIPVNPKNPANPVKKFP
jgi:hypothetical protein